MTPTSTDIQERLQSVFRLVFHRHDLLITPKTSSWDIPGWDSLTDMQLMLEVEKQFAIRLKAAEILKLKCVGDLIELIQSKLT